MLFQPHLTSTCTDLQTNSNTYNKPTHTIYLLLAEPRRIRFTALPPGEDFDFDSRLNRFGVVVVVVVVVVVIVVVGRSLDEEALERLPLRTEREVVVFRLLTDGLEPPKEDR